MRISDLSSDVCSSDLSKDGWWQALCGAAQSAHFRPVPDNPLLRRLFSIIRQPLAHGCCYSAGDPALQDGNRRFPLRGSSGQSLRRSPTRRRSEEHTSELQSLMRSSHAVFRLKKKQQTDTQTARKYAHMNT